MSSVDENQVQITDFKSRLIRLKQRQQQTMWLTFSALCVLALSTFAVFTQAEFIYGFWGLSQTVQQLHIPASVDLNALDSAQVTDYFGRLLSWLGWLILKLGAAFFGAFISIRLMRKFEFFKHRLKSVVLKFVAWLIAFGMIWSLLSFVQYQKNEAVQQPYQALLQYDQNIQSSELAQYAEQAKLAPAVRDYLLAQAALLHRPVDQAAASSYVQGLILAENSQANFASYGFKPEQLWSMQQQLYGKSLTPTTQKLDQQAKQAQRVSTIVAWVLYVCMALAGLLAAFSYLLARQLGKRRLRIEMTLHDVEFRSVSSNQRINR